MNEEFGRRLLLVGLSAVFGILSGVIGLVLRLLWPEKHRPVIGFLWLLLGAVFVREGMTALLLIGAAADLLPEEGVVLAVIGIGWMGTQFLTVVPALGLGLYVLGVIDERWIGWLFRQPGAPAARPPVDREQGDGLTGG